MTQERVSGGHVGVAHAWKMAAATAAANAKVNPPAPNTATMKPVSNPRQVVNKVTWVAGLVWEFLLDYLTLPLLGLSAVAMGIFSGFAGGFARSAYVERSMSDATHFHASMTVTHPTAAQANLFGVLFLASVAFVLVFAVLTLLVWADDTFEGIMYGLGILVVGGVIALAPGAMAYTSYNSGESAAVTKMQIEMNNWIVHNLHVPADFDITIAPTYSRDYLEYAPGNKPVYFTISSTPNTVDAHLTQR